MKNFLRIKLAKSFPLTLLALCLSTSSLAGDEAPDDPLAQRVDMVRTLIFESSAARKIEASRDEAALSKRSEAEELFERATGAGEAVDREDLLNQAVAKLYEAVALVKDTTDRDEKGRSDFDNRKESLDALLAAHERIMVEKGTPELHASLLAEIDADSRGAGALLEAGNTDEARRHLDRAYSKIMQSVEHSRSGETLTRELKFASPKDEYLYEVDRNDTHRMLVTILLEEKLKNDNVKQRVTPLIGSADELRVDAAQRAGEGRHEEATKLMERSTRELVKAIRAAGVYIPG